MSNECRSKKSTRGGLGAQSWNCDWNGRKRLLHSHLHEVCREYTNYSSWQRIFPLNNTWRTWKHFSRDTRSLFYSILHSTVVRNQEDVDEFWIQVGNKLCCQIFCISFFLLLSILNRLQHTIKDKTQVAKLATVVDNAWRINALNHFLHCMPV